MGKKFKFITKFYPTFSDKYFCHNLTYSQQQTLNGNGGAPVHTSTHVHKQFWIPPTTHELWIKLGPGNYLTGTFYLIFEIVSFPKLAIRFHNAIRQHCSDLSVL